MNLLKVTTTDGNTEYINADKILTISPRDNGDIKILLGAGIYYFVKPESITQTTLTEVLKHEQL